MLKDLLQFHKQQKGEEGYTLIELIMTIFIMGMMLLIINIVLIAILRSSARSDTSIRLRQLVEFGFEVIERNAKSAEPNSICISRYDEINEIWDCTGDVSGGAIKMSIMGSDQIVVFYVDENEDEVGVLKAFWTEGDETSEVFLTNSGELDVESFEVDLSHDYESGTHEIIVRILCDSIVRLEAAEPLVNDMMRTVTIVTKGKEV